MRLGKEDVSLRRRVAKEIVDILPQVITVRDLKNLKKIISVRVGEEESILIQYYLFERGWRTVSRKFDEKNNLKSTRKIKFKFEPPACTSIKIEPDGTFVSPISGYNDRSQVNITFEELFQILNYGYIMVELNNDNKSRY